MSCAAFSTHMHGYAQAAANFQVADQAYTNSMKKAGVR